MTNPDWLAIAAAGDADCEADAREVEALEQTAEIRGRWLAAADRFVNAWRCWERHDDDG